jgi:hypothetical protein
VTSEAWEYHLTRASLLGSALTRMEETLCERWSMCSRLVKPRPEIGNGALQVRCEAWAARRLRRLR